MSCQGLSPEDCAALTAANTTSLSSYLNAPDTAPPSIDTGVLPDNLQAKVRECEGNDNCKLIGYDFLTNVGEKASSSPYLIQLESTSGNVDKTDVAVLAKIGSTPVTSLGIPTQNLTSQYKSDHLQLTPPIASGPIGYSYLGEGTALSGIGTSFSGTSADACATECSTRDCQGFNFDESSSSCALFPLVEKEAVIGTATLLQSNKGTTLTLNLKNPVTGLATGQIVDGLSSYINGDVTIRQATSSTQIQVGFSEQIALAIPVDTPFRIKNPMTVSALQSYTSDQAHINFIGVNGNETYGYNAKFKITGLPGLPTVTNGTIPTYATPIAELVVPVNMSGITSVLSTGYLPIAKVGGPACNTGVYSTNDVQTTACSCSTASIDNPSCKIPMNVKSYTSTGITFQLPSNSTLPLGSVSGSPLTLNAIEFTVNLDPTSPVPSDRIIGWSGKITQASGNDIPVVVKSFTSSSITFTFPSQSYGTINVQDVVLSDTKGKSCDDIKACNASIQRLLDTSGISSFSTKDLVACSGCNERAYNKPISGTINLPKLREYLWFENAGAYACTGTAPPGTTLDDTCTPVCTTTTANGDTAYDSATQACRVTCRPGFYWDGSSCVGCPSITLPTNITVQSAASCQATCMHATGTTPANMIIGTTNNGSGISAIPNYTTACTVSCSSGFPNSTNTRCCPAVTPPTGTAITGYTDDCATPVCVKTDGTNDFIDTVTGASGPTCSYTCQSVTTNNGTTSVVNASDTTQSGVILPAKNSAFTTLTAADPELAGTGDIQTNIGTYVFSPQGSRAAIYTGSGTPTQYTLPPGGVLTVEFPFKIKIEQIQFWKTTATSVNINLKNVQGGTDVLSQTLTFSSSTTFTGSQPVFGRFLTLTFANGGTVAYKITATIQKICTVVCNPPSGLANGRVVLDSTRVCKIICNQGYTPGLTGCSNCPAVTLDPGTSSSFNSADCGGSCTVFNPILGNANSLPSPASAYAGTTNTNPATFAAGDTGTARACHIKACTSDRTMYTDSGNTTLNNSGCCPIPTIPNNSGITWSYPANGTTVVSACKLSCTAPSTYGMTTAATQPTSTVAASCSRVCPTYTNPPGFIIDVNSETCQPTCALATADGNGYATTSGYGSSIVCTKMCNPNNTKDSALSKCCPTWTGGTNITITYGTSTCSATPCSVTDNTSGYASIGHTASNRTCAIACKDRGTDQTGTTGSYSTDSKCTFTCSQPNQTTYPNGTGNPTSDASGKPYCSFGCSGDNYKSLVAATTLFAMKTATTPIQKIQNYKSLSAYKCCANITQNPGTTVTKRNDATCDFDCALSDTTTYPAERYTSTASGRACVLGCVNPSQPTGTSATTPTVAGGCNNFTCSLASNKPSTIYTIATSGQGCVLGCVSGYYMNGSTCCKNVALGTGADKDLGTGCDFTCKVTSTTTYPSSMYTTFKVDKTIGAVLLRSCSLTCVGNNYMPYGKTDLCCAPVTQNTGTVVNYNTNDCGFSCSIASGQDQNLNITTDTTNRSCTLGTTCKDGYYKAKNPGTTLPTTCQQIYKPQTYAIYNPVTKTMRDNRDPGASFTGDIVTDINPSISTVTWGSVKMFTCPSGSVINGNPSNVGSGGTASSSAAAWYTDPEGANPKNIHSDLSGKIVWIKGGWFQTVSCKGYTYRAATGTCPTYYYDNGTNCVYTPYTSDYISTVTPVKACSIM